jgi:mono/diheme cytochrome c family protein
VRFFVVLVGLLAGATFLLAACGGGDSPGVVEGGDLAQGREAFVASCGGCHEMVAAGTQGTQGPNLDVAFGPSREQGFDESTFQQVVRSQIAYPGIGSSMPPDLVTGQDADNVSYFVAQCAGNDEDSQCAPAGPSDSTDGATIFTQNCASCHALAAAGATGTIGPNLDESQPSAELATDRVTNGSGAMPAFADVLSEEQIQAVVDYVVQNAG